jgi:hypothetical protein
MREAQEHLYIATVHITATVIGWKHSGKERTGHETQFSTKFAAKLSFMPCWSPVYFTLGAGSQLHWDFYLFELLVAIFDSIGDKFGVILVIHKRTLSNLATSPRVK